MQGNAVRHLPSLERARNSGETPLPTAPNGLRDIQCLDQRAIGLTDWHCTASFLQPGFQSFENTTLDSPRMKPFLSYFPFTTNTIASKSIGSAVKVFFQTFFSPCHKYPTQTFHHCVPQANSLFIALVARKGKNQRVCGVRSQRWQAG